MTTLTAHRAAELFRGSPHRLIDVGAGEVAYRRVGTGPDVLFVHGWPVSGATFRTLLPFLVDHVTCHVIDLPGAGSSRFTAATPITLAQHVRSTVAVLDRLGLDDVAVVGHDSGGLIARHALAGDHRVRAFGLIDTEQPQGLSWRFRLFLAMRRAPGLAAALGWLAGHPRLRRHPLVLGRAFADPDLLDGEFDEFFLRPLREQPARAVAAATLLRGFDTRFVRDLPAVHRRMRVPVHLVWGERDAFFPLRWAREMVDTLPDARLTVVQQAGLFSHEERPDVVASALLPTLGKGG
ncbi:MAG: alpha/beta fold hydrolase [Nocardioides sp.]